MSKTRIEYKFREHEVVCALTRDIKTSCIRKETVPQECHDCLRRNGIESERRFDLKSNGTITLHPCQSEGGTCKPFVRKEKKVGRNEMCTCGSGKKFKKCCCK